MYVEKTLVIFVKFHISMPRMVKCLYNQINYNTNILIINDEILRFS